MKEPLFENADGIFHRRFETGFPDLGGKDHRVVVLRPFSVVLIQLRLDPVLVRDHGLFAVIAHNDGRNTAKGFQRVVIDLDPLHLLCGFHAFRINVLGIRKDRNKHDDWCDLASKAVDTVEGLACEINLHRLGDHCCEVGCLVVLLAPLAKEFTELPVLVRLLLLGLAALYIPIPAHLKRHVLSLVHELQDLLVVRILVAFVPAAFTGHLAIHLHGNPGVCDPRRKRKIQFITLFEGMDELQYSGLAHACLAADFSRRQFDHVVLVENVSVV